MTFYYTLLEHYQLMESLESTIKSNPHIPESIIRGYHSNALPDNNKNDRLLSHVLKMHKTGSITPESAHLLKPHLTALAATNRLNKLKELNTLDDHVNATKDIMDKSITKKERIDINTPIIADTPDILVRQHLNHESAVKGAMMHPENPMYNKTNEKGKAQWCLSVGGEDGEEHFDHYTENGKNPMYTVFNKKTKKLSAIVAIPPKGRIDLEVRGEADKKIYPPVFLANNKGLIDTPVGAFFQKYYPEHVKNSYKVISAQDTVKHITTLPELNTAFKGNNEYLKTRLLNHPLLQSHHITDLLKHKLDPEYSHIVANKIINHPLLQSHHITDLLKHNLNEYACEVVNNEDPEHITTLSKIVKHPKFNNDHRLQILENCNARFADIRNTIATDKSADSSFINTVLDKYKNDPKILVPILIGNPNVNEGHITQALQSPNEEIRAAASALLNKNANRTHVNIATYKT